MPSPVLYLCHVHLCLKSFSSREKSLSRKNRAKPRPRKPSKLTMAFADISTQETTTPGQLPGAYGALMVV